MQEIPPIGPGSSPPPEQASGQGGAYEAMAKSKGWQNFFNMFHPPMTDPKQQAKLMGNMMQLINNEIGQQLKSALKALRKMKKVEEGRD